MSCLNHDGLRQLSADAFQQQRPYPWVNIQDTLTPQGFERLRDSLPHVSLFTRTTGDRSAYGRAYHDRYILHYRPNVALADPWREFIAELHGPAYQGFIRRMFGLVPGKRMILTMDWFYAWQGCSVSPHCDAQRKLGTHIFYFNTDEDWNSCWGGNVLIQDDDGRLQRRSAPSFDQLKVAASLDPRGNGSLLFQRTAHSWHAVHPLECLPGALRKLFLVTINNGLHWQVCWRRLRGKDADGYRLKAA